MGEIKKTKNFGLGLPEHFDPSVDKMSQNMELIDSALFRSVPSTVSSLNFNTALETGTYLIKGNATGTPHGSTTYNYAVEVFATDNTHVYQIARSMADSKMHFRYRHGSTNFSNWTTIWNSVNDGSGSGLDADLLDNVQGSGYVRNFGKTYTDFNAIDRTGFYQISGAKNSPDGTGGLWGCITFQTDGGTSTNNYLCQIAIKDNSAGKRLYTRKRNGSSNWTAWESIWTSATDGSGSGLDADTLDGRHATGFVYRTLSSTALNIDTNVLEGVYSADHVTSANPLPFGILASDTGFGIANKCLSGAGNTSNVVQYLTVTGKTELYCRIRKNGVWGNWEITGSSGYDFIVKSQEDFIILTSSTTWNNCSRVYIKSGTYTVSEDYNRLLIPDTVIRIDCDNDVVIQCDMVTSAIDDGKNLTIRNMCIKSMTSGFEGFNNVRNLYDCKAICNHFLGSSGSSSHPVTSCYTGCTNLYNCSAELIYPEPDEEGNSVQHRVYTTAFIGCYNLNSCSVYVKSTDERQTQEGYLGLFSNCSYLSYCSCSLDTVKSDNVKIAFFGCHNLNYCTVNARDSIKERYYETTVPPERPSYLPEAGKYQYGFYECRYLYKCTALGSSMGNFQYCRYLIDCSKNPTGKYVIDMSSLIQTTNLLTEIKKVDGDGSGLDADLLDGRHGYGFSTAGTSNSLLTTGSPNSTTSCLSQMYRFYDTDNVIGEGANKYYGIIQVYSSSSSYMRIAVSFSSGKVYRQTNGASAWSEITPLIPTLTTDPSNPSDGQIWVITNS